MPPNILLKAVIIIFVVSELGLFRMPHLKRDFAPGAVVLRAVRMLSLHLAPAWVYSNWCKTIRCVHLSMMVVK